VSTWQNSFVLSISWLSVGPRHQSFCSCESSENSILITEAVIVPNACTDVRIDQVALSKRSIVWSTCMMAVCSKEWRSCSFAAPARPARFWGTSKIFTPPPPPPPPVPPPFLLLLRSRGQTSRLSRWPWAPPGGPNQPVESPPRPHLNLRMWRPESLGLKSLCIFLKQRST